MVTPIPLTNLVVSYALAALFLPFCAFVIIGLFTLRLPKLSAAIATGALFVSLILSMFLVLGHQSILPCKNAEWSFAWVTLPGLQFEFGILLNPLSLSMLLVVLIVALAVFYYSVEYMEGDTGFGRYFAYLSLFTFSMLGIVLSNNFLQLFIFWELVGLSSYLLIGFWYKKPQAADAGKKAFIVNRLGDYGFLIGILMLWAFTKAYGTGTLNFLRIETLLGTDQATRGAHESLALISLLIFCGVLGKSAQFPLHVWLPDAMEGPTPVSALIHAATMVAAGVYLLARTFFLFAVSPFSLEVIAYIGGFTAIFAATQALAQTDIKRVLAYSTLSQLGYMVLAIGLGSSGIAMFHLTTHAFFKALLFLGAGSVIHMTHEQDIRKLGGLFRDMPVTAVCFMIGALSLAGVFPLSGFWSKDEILVLASGQNPFLFYVAIFTAFLTAVYSTRLVVLTFFGQHTSKMPHAGRAKDPKQWMLVPLLVLTALSVLSGKLGIEKLLHQSFDHHVDWNLKLALSGSLASLLGIGLGFWLYQLAPGSSAALVSRFKLFHQLFANGYYVDRFYDWILMYVQKPVAEACEQFELKIVIQTLVNGTAHAAASCGDWARRLQTGRIQTYTTVFLGGVILMIGFFIMKGLY